MGKSNYTLSNDTWTDAEIEAIYSVIKSNRYTMGQQVAEFESRFADYFGAKYAVMVNSGSSANLIAIAALIYTDQLKKGDEIIVPAVSWSTTYYPLLQYGLKTKFIDIDLETLNIDLNCVEQAITLDTKAIFAVNLLGNPNDFDRLTALCERHNLILIEDNCESMGARYKGKYCGNIGLVGTFSTYYSHHICTIEGGVAITNDQKLYETMLCIRSHGWTRHLSQDALIYQKNDNPFYEAFNFILPGYNLRPIEIEAAIGLRQLEKLPEIIRQRRENAREFQNLFVEAFNHYIPPPRVGQGVATAPFPLSEEGRGGAKKVSFLTQKEIGESSWFGFSLICHNEMDSKRDEVVQTMTNAGIETRPIVAGNFTKNPVIKYFDYEIPFPLTNADYLHNNGFFVGNHSVEMREHLVFLFDVLKHLTGD